jgi:hypothetical protein
VTGGKPIAILLQSISGVNYYGAINPLVAFYYIREGKREVLYYFVFYFVPDTTRDFRFVI